MPAAGGDRAGSQRGLLAALGMSIILATFGYVLIGPFFPEIAADLDSTVPLLGQVSAARLLLAAVFGLVAGPLADGFGHRRVMAVGLVAASLTLLGIGSAPTYGALALTAIPGAIAGATLTGLSLAVAGTAFAGESRRTAIGWIIGAQALSAVLGVPVLVALGGAISWRFVFLACGALGLAISPLIVRALPAGPRSASRAWRTEIAPRRLAAAYRPVLRHRPALRLFTMTGLRSITWGAMVTYFGAYIKEDVALSDGVVGLAFFLTGIAFFAGSVAAGRRLAFAPLPLLSGAGDLVTAIAIGLLFAASWPASATIAVGAVAAFCGAFAYVGISTMLTTATPGGSGTTMTLNGSLFSLGSAAGGVIGGILLSLGDYTLLGVVAPIFMIAAAGLALNESHIGRQTNATRRLSAHDDSRADDPPVPEPSPATQPGP